MKKLLLLLSSLIFMANCWAYHFAVDGICYNYQIDGNDTIGIEVAKSPSFYSDTKLLSQIL